MPHPAPGATSVDVGPFSRLAKWVAIGWDAQFLLFATMIVPSIAHATGDLERYHSKLFVVLLLMVSIVLWRYALNLSEPVVRRAYFLSAAVVLAPLAFRFASSGPPDDPFLGALLAVAVLPIILGFICSVRIARGQRALPQRLSKVFASARAKGTGYAGGLSRLLIAQNLKTALSFIVGAGLALCLLLYFVSNPLTVVDLHPEVGRYLEKWPESRKDELRARETAQQEQIAQIARANKVGLSFYYFDQADFWSFYQDLKRRDPATIPVDLQQAMNEFEAIQGEIKQSMEESYVAYKDVGKNDFNPLYLYGFLIAATTGALTLARKWLQPDARKLLLRDKRPPSVFLRSFSDDKGVFHGKGLAAWIKRFFLAFYDAKREPPHSIEYVISREIAHYGPFVAIGMPNEDAPRLGAARAYVEEGIWKDVVLSWLKNAKFIVLVVGSSPGILWELKTVLDSGYAHKLIFAFPPMERNERTSRWSEVCKTFQGTPLHRSAYEAKLDDAIGAFYANPDTLVVVKDAKPQRLSYETLIALAISSTAA